MHGRRRALTLTLAIATALAVALAVALLVGAGGARTARREAVSTGAAPRFDGAPLAGARAPDFALSDERGRRVSLSEYRGRVVVLTFLYTTCGAPCVLIAQQIRGALDELREKPAVLIVSADPAADTPPRVARFLARMSLSGRAEYLTGPLASVRAVWSAYGVKPASAGRASFAEYASVLLIDARGRERVLFESEQLTPEALSHDVASLQAGG